MAFQRVAIVGLGLIGTSLGLALRRQPRPPKIDGCDRDRDARHRAVSRKAVDRATADVAGVVEGADLVIVATPVRTLGPLLTEIRPRLAPGCVVTDTGSTKAQVVALAAELAPDVAFVGGHPMAGRLTAGTDDADAALFEQSIYCLTPTERTPPEAVARVVELVETVGARPHFLGPQEHDGLVAAVSHLPYLLSSTLMGAVSTERGWRERALLAAGGFATMTRLVEGEPVMYADICLTNRAAILQQLDRFAAELDSLRAAIAAGDEGLRDRFAALRDAHQSWLHERAGPPSTEIPVADLKGPNLLFPARWTDALRGRRPAKDE